MKQTIKNTNKPITESAKIHVPYINIEKGHITLGVGNPAPHPMTEEHRIESIKIIKVDNGEFNDIFETKPETNPINIDIKLEKGDYKIQAKCNLHGTRETNVTF